MNTFGQMRNANNDLPIAEQLALLAGPKPTGNPYMLPNSSTYVAGQGNQFQLPQPPAAPQPATFGQMQQRKRPTQSAAMAYHLARRQSPQPFGPNLPGTVASRTLDKLGMNKLAALFNFDGPMHGGGR